MIVPKGELLGIFRGKPEEFFNKVDNGYLKISWKDSDELYSACVVFKNGIAVFADLELVRSKRVLKGKEALKKILTTDYGVIEVYKLSEKQVSLVSLMNSEDVVIHQKVEEKPESKTALADETKKVRVEEKEEIKEEKKKEEEKFEVVENFEEFVYNLEDDFSGIIVAKGDDREATLYVKDGVIIGAKVKFNDTEYLGLSALYYLDFKGTITRRKLDDVEKYLTDEVRIDEISLDKDEILKKYNITPPDEKTVERFLKILNELSAPTEKKKILRKLFKLFKTKGKDEI